MLGVGALAGLLWIGEPGVALAVTLLALVVAGGVAIGLVASAPAAPGLGVSTPTDADPPPDPHGPARRVASGAALAVAIVAAHLAGIVTVAVLVDHGERVVVAVRLLLAYVPPLLVAAGALALGSRVGAVGVGFVVPGLLMGVALAWEADPGPASIALALLAAVATAVVVLRPWRGAAELVLTTSAGALVVLAVLPFASPAFALAVGPFMDVPHSPVGNVAPGPGRALLLAVALVAAILLVVVAVGRRRPWDAALPGSVLVVHVAVLGGGGYIASIGGARTVVVVVALAALVVGLALLLWDGSSRVVDRLPAAVRDVVRPSADGPIAFFGAALVGVALQAVPVLMDPGRGRDAAALVLLGLAAAIALALRGSAGALVAGAVLVGLGLQDPVSGLLLGPRMLFPGLIGVLAAVVATGLVAGALVRACPRPGVVAAAAFAILGPLARLVSWCVREGDAGPTVELLLPLYLPIGLLVLGAGVAALLLPGRLVAGAQAAGAVGLIVASATTMALSLGLPRAPSTIPGLVELAPTLQRAGLGLGAPYDALALVLTLLLVGALPLVASVGRRRSIAVGAATAYAVMVLVGGAAPALQEHRAVVAILVLLVASVVVMLAVVVALAEGRRTTTQPAPRGLG